MSDDHIVSSFNEDMSRLEAMFLEMGDIVIAQLKSATRALRKEDRVLAKQVVKGDKQLNKMEAELNDLAIKILALRQPFAGDLRKVVTTLKSAGHLERIGDLTRNMAQRTNTITKAEADTGPIDTLIRMSEIVQDMIASIMVAYKTEDTDLAVLVRSLDQSVDTSHNALFREMLTYMMEDLRNISGCMHVMFMAKNIERMGDNVADIAKELIYMNTGDWPEGKRTKSDKTSKMILERDHIEK
jgi:phosphate transport system protein